MLTDEMALSVGTANLLLTFATARPLNLQGTNSVHQRTSICMKTKSPNDKRAAKSKRVSVPSSSSGFGASKSNKENKVTKSATSKGQSEQKPAKKVENVSGAAGDATPHQVNVENPNDALQDPSRELEEDAPPPLIELPQLNVEEARALRYDFGSTLDELVEYFADASERDDFRSVIVANRHHISEALLYRFTSAILQVEGRTTQTETKHEEARNMRAFRKTLISHAWSFDFPLKRAVLEAEKRTLDVLKGGNVKRDVANNCGRSQLEVNAFWIVIYAAVAAWEERGRENPALVNVDTQRVLTETAEACRKVERVKKFLSPCLVSVQEVLSSADPEKQATVIEKMDDDMVVELGCLTEAVKLLPSQAYGGLATRMSSIGDYIRSQKYKLPPLEVSPFRFNLVEIHRESGLVEFSNRSSKSKRV